MKVLHFAFDTREAGAYNPVCFMGTHNNITLKGWIEDEANASYVESL